MRSRAPSPTRRLPARSARAASSSLAAFPGTIFVVSAPSGAGKTTLCRRLLDDLDGIDFSVSFTTRAPRPGERDGTDYFFVHRKEFERRRRAGEFVEWAVINGALYGTSAVALRQAATAGSDILLDVDTQGAANIRRLFPDAVLVFVMPPGLEALKARLKKRGTEGPESMTRRLRQARLEVAKAPLYDYIVINDDLEAAYQDLHAVICAARFRRDAQLPRISALLKSFAAL